MRSLACRLAIPVAATAVVLVASAPAEARPQGTPDCPVPVPAPAPNTSYSCNFAAMARYSQFDPNLAYIMVPCATYQTELATNTEVGTPHSCGTPGSGKPYAQSWLPDGQSFSVICQAIAEAMAMNAALAYRSPNTSFTGEYCADSTQCPESFACNNNACTPAGASCDPVSAHCVTGYHCVNSACVADVACGASSPCPSGYTCGGTGVCTPVIYTARQVNTPTSGAHNPPGTYYTFGFNQAAHTAWAWNCFDFTDAHTAQTAPPPGFVGGCSEGAPMNLWPPNPGSPPATVFGLQQMAHMSIITNAVPTLGYWSTVGTHEWDYYVGMAPFALEFYNNATDGGTCWSSADCAHGYCVDGGGNLYNAPRDLPAGHCASAAGQALATSYLGQASTVSVTTAGLRAVIDQGGTGVIGRAGFQVHVSAPFLGSQAVTFTPVSGHYVALQGYTVYYDQNLNEYLGFSINDPGDGLQQFGPFVDASTGTYVRGSASLNVTLPPGVTDAVLWSVASDGTHRAITSVWDLRDGEVVDMAAEAYFIYVQ